LYLSSSSLIYFLSFLPIFFLYSLIGLIVWSKFPVLKLLPDHLTLQFRFLLLFCVSQPSQDASLLSLFRSSLYLSGKDSHRPELSSCSVYSLCDSTLTSPLPLKPPKISNFLELTSAHTGCATLASSTAASRSPQHRTRVTDINLDLTDQISSVRVALRSHSR
jgi:hypothetical protein